MGLLQEIHVILLSRGLCPDMAPGCLSLPAHHIMLILFLLTNMVECLFLGRIAGWMSSDPTLETSCEAAGGTCTLDIICRLSYGQVLEECGGVYQVCCVKKEGGWRWRCWFWEVSLDGTC